MKKVLITGGAGFIGSAVVRQFIDEAEVTVINVDKLTYAGNLDSLPGAMGDTRHVFEQVDICDAKEIARVSTLEHHQGLKVARPEEIAYGQHWIDAAQLEKLVPPLAENGYGQYLMQLLNSPKAPYVR